MIDKTLTERLVHLYQVPDTLQVDFQGDLDAEGRVISPVRPASHDGEMALTFEILPPKIPIDISSLQAVNLSLQTQERYGPDLQTSKGLLSEAEDTLYLYDTLTTIGPLTLYTNPNSIVRTATNKSTPNPTGSGQRIEHSAPEQSKLSVQGKSGVFYTDKTGLTYAYQRNSAAFKQVMHLFMIFRNNGYIYERFDPKRIAVVGQVKITYDTETWIGCFDTFSLNESADTPYSMEYSFEFTVREYFNDARVY